MAYFADLTPYTYSRPEEERRGTVNIGWLEPGYPFSTGTTREPFQIKLNQLCHRRLKQTRGFQTCGFCAGPENLLVWPGSSFEMRVARDGTVYAAPSLVHHYVATHGYRPPDGFIAAVLAWDETAPRLSQEELWASICEFWEDLCKLKCWEFSATNSRSRYKIVSFDETAKRYEVEYPSGKRYVVSSDELYAVYGELYGRGSLTSAYMKDNARRLIGWSSWDRGGAAMVAILPHLDEVIRDVKGSLYLWSPLVGEADIGGSA
jgi:hypothetical protein